MPLKLKRGTFLTIFHVGHHLGFQKSPKTTHNYKFQFLSFWDHEKFWENFMHCGTTNAAHHAHMKMHLKWVVALQMYIIGDVLFTICCYKRDFLPDVLRKSKYKKGSENINSFFDPNAYGSTRGFIVEVVVQLQTPPRHQLYSKAQHARMKKQSARKWKCADPSCCILFWHDMYNLTHLLNLRHESKFCHFGHKTPFSSHTGSAVTSFFFLFQFFGHFQSLI